MRLFLAVEIDDDTRRQLAAAQDTLQSALAHARVPPRVTWVSPRLAHVTIRFIGEASEDTVAQLRSALATLTCQPFEVTWGPVGTFGGQRNPKVVWMGVTAGLDAFTHLSREVDARVDAVIGVSRTQPFTPHLTLGRVRERGRGVDWARALQAIAIAPTVTRVARVTLYQSRISSKGPTYTAVSSHG